MDFCKNSFIDEHVQNFRINGHNFQKIFRIYWYTLQKFVWIYWWYFYDLNDTTLKSKIAFLGDNLRSGIVFNAIV